MIVASQIQCLSQLKELASADRHSIVIEGPKGCGKRYCASMFAKYTEADISYIDPTVQAIRSSLDSFYNLDNKIVACIHDLDSGVLGASYTMLKFLEEPKSSVYVIITCSSIYDVPDTIISRSTVVSISSPRDSDIKQYAEYKDRYKYDKLASKLIWKCVRSFADIDMLYSMSQMNIDYFDTLSDTARFKDSVSNITWALGHYPDNSETPIEFVVRYILCCSSDARIRKYCYACLSDLNTSKIAKHAVLTKFIFNCKYGD